MRSLKPNRFFSAEEEERIIQAIRRAEGLSSGEIRVHVVKSVPGELLSTGRKIFERLGMTRTEARNGVLFLLELSGQRFAVLGDKGIHEKVPANFWEGIKEGALGHFRSGRFAEGIVEGIDRCGEMLQQFFPRREDDRNEVPDQISYS